MTIELENVQGLIAGDGELPVRMAEAAKKSGFKVVAIALSDTNRNQLKKICDKVYSYGPGEVIKTAEALKNEGIKQVTFLGKVHKGMLLKNPKLDSTAIQILKSMTDFNDDAVMIKIIDELVDRGIDVIDQTVFIKELMVPTGVFTERKPDEKIKEDIEYGFHLAKEMGRLDIGQTVVVKNKMIIAVEAIEGTDRAIERGAKLAKKDAVVVKVAKPKQDCRFDIPTVGLNTIKNMKKHKASVLALEAGKTIIVEQQEMIKFANKNNMIIMAL